MSMGWWWGEVYYKYNISTLKFKNLFVGCLWSKQYVIHFILLM